MKSRIIIFGMLLLCACTPGENFRPPVTYPHITLNSPIQTEFYRADSAINIRGTVTDQRTIKFLSIVIFRNDTIPDTAFSKFSKMDSTACSFNENWMPDTNFAGVSKGFNMEIKVFHDSIHTVPFYYNITVVK